MRVLDFLGASSKFVFLFFFFEIENVSVPSWPSIVVFNAISVLFISKVVNF